MLNRFPGATKKASQWGAFFVCAIVAMLSLQASAAECRIPGELRMAQVAKVVDGDTLRLVDGRSVRLLGVNAPELAHDGRPAEPFAEAATRHLERLVAQSAGQVALVAGEQGRDRYGRSLAYAFGRDGRNWEAQQLVEGLGYAVAIAPNTALTGCQWAAERTARAAGKGVWRRSPVIEVGQLQQGGFALLRGRIATVERNRGGVWLTLGEALVLHVPSQWLAQFGGRDLAGLAGREVEVRGWVVDRNRSGVLRAGRARWLLDLTHPAMLEVVD